MKIIPIVSIVGACFQLSAATALWPQFCGPNSSEGESFLLAVEARTGKVRWRTSRAGSIGSYTTPITWRRGLVETPIARAASGGTVE